MSIESITVKFKNGKSAELRIESGEMTVDDTPAEFGKPMTRYVEDREKDLRIEAKISWEMQKRLEKASKGL